MHELAISLQVFVASSIFFVWVVRYDNIVEEFKDYGYPASVRDLVGILKLTFSGMLLVGVDRGMFAVIGGSGIAILMAAAFVTHLRVKSPLPKMTPCLKLLVLSILIVWINLGLRNA